MAIGTLPWNYDISTLPFDRPILVRQRGNATPVMVCRHSYYEPDGVDFLLGPNPKGYGMYLDVEDIEAWLDVI